MALGQQRKKERNYTDNIRKKKINARCFHAALVKVGHFGNILEEAEVWFN